MRIVVTGSGSFVGKVLIVQALKKGIAVTGLDLARGSDLPYEFYKIDIRATEIANAIPEGADALVHLAALSRDSDCRNNAYSCFDSNVMGTLNLMKAVLQRKVKQFIFASSEWVYNEHTGTEVTEDTPIDISRHTSEYALSKLVSEANLRQQYAHSFCPVTILRFGIIYGPRTNNWSAVESVASTVKNNDEVTVGSLKSSRCFIHVSDIANGIIKAIGLQGFNIINLSGDQVVSMESIIKTSEKIFGKSVKVIEKSPSVVSVRNPSNKKARELLHWSPEINLAAGIQTLLPFI